MKRLVKLLTFAAVIAAVAAVVKRRPVPPTAPPNRPGPTAAPVPPRESVAAVEEPFAEAAPPWTEPAADGSCPDGYPVKAKLKTKIFHVEGGVLYDRTVADRCYVSPAAAEADGLRASLR